MGATRKILPHPTYVFHIFKLNKSFAVGGEPVKFVDQINLLSLTIIVLSQIIVGILTVSFNIVELDL